MLLLVAMVYSLDVTWRWRAVYFSIELMSIFECFTSTACKLTIEAFLAIAMHSQ